MTTIYLNRQDLKTYKVVLYEANSEANSAKIWINGGFHNCILYSPIAFDPEAAIYACPVEDFQNNFTELTIEDSR